MSYFARTYGPLGDVIDGLPARRASPAYQIEPDPPDDERRCYDCGVWLPAGVARHPVDRRKSVLAWRCESCWRVATGRAPVRGGP